MSFTWLWHVHWNCLSLIVLEKKILSPPLSFPLSSSNQCLSYLMSLPPLVPQFPPSLHPCSPEAMLHFPSTGLWAINGVYARQGTAHNRADTLGDESPRDGAVVCSGWVGCVLGTPHHNSQPPTPSSPVLCETKAFSFVMKVLGVWCCYFYH